MSYFSRGNLTSIATFTVTSLLTIAAGASLFLADGADNGILFRDSDGNVSSTERITANGNAGTIALTGTGTSTFAGPVSSTRFMAENGSVSGPGHSFSSLPNYGMYAGTNLLQFSVAGGRKFYMSNSTNVTDQSLIPGLSNQYDLGSNASRFKRIWGTDGDFTETVTSTNLQATGRILSASGSAAAPSIANSADRDTGMYFGSDGIFLATNGTNRLTIDNSFISAGLALRPSADDARALGGANTRWSDVYAVDAFFSSVSSTDFGTEDSTATTSTNRLTDDTMTKPSCTAFGDTDGAGTTYLTTLNGVGTFSTTPCDN